MAGDSIDEEVDRSLVTKELKTQLLRFHLHRAQQRMQSLANKRRSDRQLQVGDWVYLKIQLYRQTTVSNQSFTKLSAKFYGPYQVIQKVGPIAYKLLLPPQIFIHPTFHISQLKLYHEVPAQFTHPPIVDPC